MSKIAIIGGGPAGLAATEACLKEGLEVTLFERNANHSGLWDSFQGSVWAGMRTNLSKYSCAFPDFPQDESTPLFPTQSDMVKYLAAYKDHFELAKRANIQYGENVAHVAFINNKYQVTSNNQTTEFDKVIVSSGFFTKPHIPSDPALNGHQDKTTHSSTIKPFKTYADRRVLVVGNGFSGCDIAAGLAEAGAKVSHLFRRAYYILPRQFPNGETIDQMFYKHQELGAETSKTREEEFSETHESLSALCQNQVNVHPLLQVDKNASNPPHVSVATGYLEAVENQTITLIKGELEAAGALDDYDDIVLATGFRTDLSFLDTGILDAISYDPDNSFMPATLHEGVWNAKYKDMAFVGMYRGPYFLSIALQAQWAAKAFSKPDKFYPTPIEVEVGIHQAMSRNAETPRRQFPYGDYNGYIERLANRIKFPNRIRTVGEMLSPRDFNK